MIILRNEIALNEKLPTPVLNRMSHTHQKERGKNVHSYFYLTEAQPESFVLWQLSDLGFELMEELKRYLDSINCPSGRITQVRGTASAFAEEMRNQSPVCINTDYVLKKHHLKKLTACCEADTVLEYTVDRQQYAGKNHNNSALKRFCKAMEIVEDYPGNFYEIQADSDKSAQELSIRLLAWMDQNGHFPAGRAVTMIPLASTSLNGTAEEIYTAMEGGAVVLLVDESIMGSSDGKYLTELAHAAAAHRETVRTILCLDPQNGRTLTQKFWNELEIEPFFIEQRQTQRPISETKKFSRAEAERKPSAVARPKKAETGRPKKNGQNISAEKELEGMIGLTEAKRLLKQITDFAKLQKLMQERGLVTEMPCLHMVFTGNPGTAKTTVARLTARIFKEHGVLSKGELIEVGRADLVGRYVGWTSQNVQEKFMAAKGSVLFIDEAYSLCEEHHGEYGDEAINTIVQEMENHRADTVVILAGYREEMQELLNRNPGLRSRVPYHVDFPDYTEEELWQITQHKALENGRIITPEAEKKVRDILSAAVRKPDFGNGRFSRNLVEQALLRQAERLMQGDVQNMSDEMLRTLFAEDFTAKQLMDTETRKHTVGFCVPAVQLM